MTTNSAGMVYVETSIISYLTARSPRELLAAAWQAATIDWWDNHRHRFQLFTSELTFQEASRSDRAASARRLAALEGMIVLPYTDAVDRLVAVFTRSSAVPEGSRDDAVHIAEAAVHGIDYLLSWNFRHLNNVVAQPLIRALCDQEGYTSPQICSPFELIGLTGEIIDG